MGLYNLEKIFDPESVAIIGASNTEGTIGHALLKNLSGGGYGGDIIPVNPKYSEMNGLKVYPSLSKAGRSVDLAVIATPMSTVPGLVAECVDTGVKACIIISAGGREAGEEGRQIEEKIEETARKGGLRIIGPNCMGIIRPGKNLNASFAAHMPRDGKVAFISQSGAICSAVLDLSVKEKMGFSYFVSIGSMLDVDFGDLIDHLGNEPDVKSILVYIESLKHFRKFMSAAREVSRVKPIVVLKAGKSAAGAKAAASHTGAMAGEDAAYDAAFQRAGIARVGNLDDFFDCAELLAKQSPPAGKRLVVLTNSGGPGVMAADAAAEHGLELVPLGDEVTKRLDDLLPPHWSKGNPIDILGDATAERYAGVLDCCFKETTVDGMLVILNPQAMTDPTEVARALSGSLKSRPYPVFAAWMGGADVEKGIEILNREGIPTYATPERAIRSFKVLYEYSRNLEMLQEIPSRLPGMASLDENEARRIIDEGLKREQGVLTETESKDLLASYGIAVNRTEVAASAEEAVHRGRRMGFPVVMKVHSAGISHKTEAGGVKVGLRSDDDLRAAWEEIMKSAAAYDPKAAVEGVTLQPMIENPDAEILVGAKRDRNFGPLILFGAGGIYAEIMGDKALGLVPLNQALAQRLMKKTRVFRILQGYRNRPGADMALMERMIVNLSHLLTDFPEIHELDLNPVIVKEGRPRAVDARVIVAPSDIKPPQHLVISPYPEQYEFREVTGEGVEVLVRPIRPEDADLLMDLFNSLSDRSRRMRFFSPMKELSRDMLVRFTQIDYDRQIALVALHRDDGKEKMLGVARIMSDPDRNRAEFSVAVGDPWQGKGIGRKLVEWSLHVAREYGIKTVEGTVLAENRAMLQLGHKLGFKTAWSGGPGEYRLTMELKEG